MSDSGRMDPHDDQGGMYEEYMKLLAGGRVSSRRNQTQSVTERNRLEQLNQIKQTQRRRKEQASSKRPGRGRGRGGTIVVGGSGHVSLLPAASATSGSADPELVSLPSLGGRKRSSAKHQLDTGSQLSEEKGSRKASMTDEAGRTVAGLQSINLSRIKQKRDAKHGRKLSSQILDKAKFKSQSKDFDLGDKMAGSAADASVQSRRKGFKHHSVNLVGGFVGKHVSISPGGAPTRPFQQSTSQAPYHLPHYSAKEETKGANSVVKPSFSQMQERSNTDTEGHLARLSQDDDERSEDDSSLMSGHRPGDAADDLEAGDSFKRRGSLDDDENSGSLSNSEGFARPTTVKKDSIRIKQSSGLQSSSQGTASGVVVAAQDSSSILMLQSSDTPSNNEMQLNQSQVSVAPAANPEGTPLDKEGDYGTVSSRNDTDSKQAADHHRSKRPVGSQAADKSGGELKVTEKSSMGSSQAKSQGRSESTWVKNAAVTNPDMYTSPKKTTAGAGGITGVSPSKRIDASISLRDSWRQLEEMKALDKVFPDPQLTQGCYVQTEESTYAIIKACEKVKDTKGVSISEFQLTIEELGSSETRKVPATSIKYLARAYLCSIGEIATEKLPARILNSLTVECSGEEQSQVVLLQTISTKSATQSADSCLSEGNSAHRLHALIADAEDDQKFTLHPVVFKPSQTRNRKAKVPLRRESPETAEDKASEIASLCYQSVGVAEKSLQIARKLQGAFIQSYVDRVGQVKITRENLADSLFSIVQFKDTSREQEQLLDGSGRDQQMTTTDEKGTTATTTTNRAERGDLASTSVGIMTNYKVSGEDKQVHVFVSLFISSKVGRTAAWVPLADTAIFADFSIGLVSQKWLEKFQIHDNEATSSKANQKRSYQLTPQRNFSANKLRQLQLLNWQESLAEKQKTLHLDDLQIIREKDQLQQMTDLEDREFHQNNREAEAVNDSSLSNCKKCNYITKLDSNPQIKVVSCSRCNVKYHEWCLQPHQRKISASEEKWRCKDCERCANCKSQQCPDQLMTCIKCNTPTHYDCLAPSFKQSLRSLYSVTTDREDEDNEVKKLNVWPKRFRCEDCIKCQNCEARQAGPKRHHKWSKDFKLCHKCNQMRDKKLFCPVCERFQPSDQDESRVPSIEESAHYQGIVRVIKGENMIKCRGCEMLVHVDCDCMLKDASIRKQIMPERVEGDILKASANQAHYKCPNCRKANRNLLLEQMIDLLTAADKAGHFLMPFWEQMAPQAQQEYLDIIRREPICFQSIKSAIRHKKKYLREPKDFWKDIERVFVNAKAYNDSSEVYNAASQLHEKANQFIKNKKLAEVVEANSRATMDENRYTVSMRKVAKDLRKGIVPSSAVEQPRLPTETQATAKEMFQGSEVPDLRVFGINNSVLDVIGQPSQVSGDGGIMYYQGQLAASAEHHLNREVVKKSKLPAHKQWAKLMLDLATNDERDTCWYPNPIKISFEEPALIFEEMCYLCGAFGNQEDFLCCNLCAESFHPYCLPYPRSDREQFQDYWRCYNCIFCEKCHSSKQWEGLLICAVCDKVDHFWCLEPQLIQVPECNWKCPECFKCGKCGTKSFFSEKDIENKVNLDPNEKFVLSFDFELCYQCGQDEYRKSCCSICNEKTGFGLNQIKSDAVAKQMAVDQSSDILQNAGILRCNACNFYSHLSCSKTDFESLQRHARTFNYLIKAETGQDGTETAKSIYKCIDCLLIDRLPSFYMHHQCEIYESLHMAMQRNALLYSLVEAILDKYFADSVVPSLYISNFIAHHQKIFREDRLIRQWLALLDSTSGSQHQSETQSCTEEVAVVVQPSGADKVDSSPRGGSGVSLQPADEEESKVAKTPPSTIEHAADTVMADAAIAGTSMADTAMIDESSPMWNEQVSCLPQSTATTMALNADILPGNSGGISDDLDTDPAIAKKEQVFQDLYGHKTGFVPLRRDLYENLLMKENNRAAQKQFFEPLDDLADKITVPTDDAIAKVNLNELFVKIELRAVLKIRLLFMQWAQELVYNTVKQISSFNNSAQQLEPNSQLASDQKALTQTNATKNVERPQSVELVQNALCQEVDSLVDNPQKLLKCLLCGLNGERQITGRLIPFQINQFVHVNCAMWTQEVQEGREENDSTVEIYNMFFAYNEFKNRTCIFCKRTGATLFCSNHFSKRCGAAFHFPCAYSSKKVAFLVDTDIYCEQCIPKTPGVIAGFPIELRDYPRRRIIIVDNIEPQCTNAFQNQIRKSNQGGANQTGPSGRNMPVAIEAQSAQQSSPSVKDMGVQNQQSTDGVAPENIKNANGGDMGVIVACNKWRPFYYDMFNRVGNLTLLSLSRRRNAVIESLHTFTHQHKKSTWHERFNLRFPEENQTDFASLRIYWSYNDAEREEMVVDDEQAETAAKPAKKGPPSKKGYFLFNSNKVLGVDRHDYTKLRKFINQRLSERLSSKTKELALAQRSTHVAASLENNKISSTATRQRQTIEQFWLEQISNLALRYPLFCQENTYLTSKVISGLEKFPIQYWNNPGEKLVSPGEKPGLELKDLNVAGFFFKSGTTCLELQGVVEVANADGDSQMANETQVAEVSASARGATSGVTGAGKRNEQAKDQAGLQVMSLGQNTGMQEASNTFQLGTQAGAATSGGATGQNTSTGPISAAKNTSLESIFKQILDANQVNDAKTAPLIVSLVAADKHDEEDEDGSRKDLSTKVMNYEQIMACLGKKTLKVKQEERRKMEEERAREEHLKQQQMQLQQMYGGSQFPMFHAGTADGADSGTKIAGQAQGNEEKKDSNQNPATGLNLAGQHHHQGERRRKGSRLSDLNELSNKGNDINTAMKYRAAKERPKLVEVWISKIHRNGLFACQPLAHGDIVIEYVGEKIRDPVADKREFSYEKLGVGDCYNFRLNKDYIIDATFFGSKARYINHSCEPNLISEYLNVNGETHIIFVAARHIKANEELTFDYNFQPEIESIECFCGSEKCRGRLC